MEINKAFICFAALVISACDGTLFSGGSAPTKIIDVVAHPNPPLNGYNYGYGGAGSQAHRTHGYTAVNHRVHQRTFPQVIKVILDQSEGHNAAATALHGYYNDHGVSSSYASAPYTQYYKIIDHVGGAPISQGYSRNTAHGYAASSHDVSKQLYAILPQILQIIFEKGGEMGVGPAATHYGQLIDAYGRSGRAIITRNEGVPSADLRGGHVVERGILEVKSDGNGRVAASPHPHPHPHYQTHHHYHPASVKVGW